MDMIDPFGRTVSYLRVSVTDRCDFRCTYCMAENMAFLPKKDLLTLEELDRLCTVFVEKGVKKLRLTGGEPLVRKNIMHLVRQLSRHLASGALEELTLTTNGSQLTRFAPELVDCGVKRINISIDTLDADKFHAITRWGNLSKVLEGIDAAQAAGLHVKLNAVALKGFNDKEMPELMRWAHGRGADLTVIDPSMKKTLAMNDLHVRDYSPWEGWEVMGWPTTVILRGHVMVDNGQLLGDGNVGRLIPRKVDQSVLQKPAF